MSMAPYRSPSNLLPGQFSARDARDDDLALAVEAHNLHTDGASSPALDLVFVAEEIDTRFTAPIVQTSFDQDTQHGTFASIDCA
jgi:hypothetical protein